MVQESETGSETGGETGGQTGDQTGSEPRGETFTTWIFSSKVIVSNGRTGSTLAICFFFGGGGFKWHKHGRDHDVSIFTLTNSLYLD